MINRIAFKVNALKDHLKREKLVSLLKVEDPAKQHLSCRRARERRAARIEILPNGDQRSNERRGPDRRQQSANLRGFWSAVVIWAIVALVFSLVLATGRFTYATMPAITGFYLLSIVYFAYLSYRLSRLRNRRKSDRNGYFYVILAILAFFSFIMCEVSIYLY